VTFQVIVLVEIIGQDPQENQEWEEEIHIQGRQQKFK
jgi:hypothetical protein